MARRRIPQNRLRQIHKWNPWKRRGRRNFATGHRVTEGWFGVGVVGPFGRIYGDRQAEKK